MNPGAERELDGTRASAALSASSVGRSRLTVVDRVLQVLGVLADLLDVGLELRDERDQALRVAGAGALHLVADLVDRAAEVLQVVDELVLLVLGVARRIDAGELVGELRHRALELAGGGAELGR